jgi:DNA-binding NtrC family response regulator
LEKVTILVVDDEALIRMGTSCLLQDAGYAVLEAADAEAAIKLLESRNDIRVVFTDIKMQGTLSGFNLVHAVFERWPPVHLIVASGLSGPFETEFPGTARFLQKPYAPEQVLCTLDELLGPNPAPYRFVRNVPQKRATLHLGNRR